MQVTALVPVPIALFGLGKKPNREPCIIVVSLLKKKKEGKKRNYLKNQPKNKNVTSLKRKYLMGSVIKVACHKQFIQLFCFTIGERRGRRIGYRPCQCRHCPFSGSSRPNNTSTLC